VYEREELRLSIGDTVRITKNHPSSDGVTLLNNWRFGIESISESGLMLTNGAKLDLRRPMHLDQGYAVTSHSSQGQTVDQVLVAAPVRSMNLVSAIMFYVGVSRARNHVQVFTDSRAALLEAVEENLGVRTAAVEAMGEVKPSSDEIRRKETQQHRREQKQRERDEAARKRDEAREAERNADKVILARLFRSGRLGTGKDREDVVARAPNFYRTLLSWNDVNLVLLWSALSLRLMRGPVVATRRTWNRFVLGMRESWWRDLPSVIRIPPLNRKPRLRHEYECWLSAL
jgi:hypothetical protein